MLGFSDSSRAPAALFLAIGLCGLSGCAGIRPLDVSHGLPVLEKGEGILVVDVETNAPLETVEISGEAVLEQIRAGEYFQFVALPSGRYRWNEITRKIGGYTVPWILGSRYAGLVFDVEPGVVNYPGTLIVEADESVWWRIYLNVRNRTAKTFVRLEREHSALLEAFSLRYSGGYRDDFLERYLADRARSEGPKSEAAAQ